MPLNCRKVEPLTYFENTKAVPGYIRSNSNGDRGLAESVNASKLWWIPSVILHAPITIKGKFYCAVETD